MNRRPGSRSSVALLVVGCCRRRSCADQRVRRQGAGRVRRSRSRRRGCGRKRRTRWERATVTDPTYAAAWNNLGIGYEQLGRFDDARKAYEKALELDPDNTFIKPTTICSGKSMTARTVVAIASRRCGLATAGCVSFYESRSRRRSRRSSTSRHSSACWSPASSAAARRTSTRTRKPHGCCEASCGRSRTCSVIDADVLQLVEEVRQAPRDAAAGRRHRLRTNRASRTRGPAGIRSDLTDAEYWKKIGEEYQGPLIVTGSVLFTEVTRSGMVSQPRRTPTRRARCRSRNGASSRTRRATPSRPSSSSSTAGRAPALLRVVPRRGAVSGEPEHPGAVVLLRADGQAAAGLPEHAVHPEDPRHPDPHQVGRPVFAKASALA